MGINDYSIYEATVNMLENNFKELDGILDTSYFRSEFDSIISEVQELEDAKSLQVIEYSFYNNKLKEILVDMDNELLPFRDVYLLTKRVNEICSLMDENNYSENVEVINDLVDGVCHLDSDRKLDCKKIIDDAIEAIYNVLLIEAVYNQNKVFNKCISVKNYVLTCGITECVRKDQEAYHNIDIARIMLKHVNDGKVRNYLTSEIIKRMSLEKYNQKSCEYNERRNSATSAYLERVDALKEEKENLDKEKKGNKEERFKIIKRITGVRAKMLSILVVIPLLGTLVGGYIGSLFKTTKCYIKTYNKDTKEQIGEVKEKYYLGVYKYKIEVTKYSPWRENGTNGYKRDVEKWTYYDNSSKESVDPDEILKSIKRTSLNHETKAVIRESDNTTTDEIIVEETISDDSDTRLCWPLIALLAVLVGTSCCIPYNKYLSGSSSPYRNDKWEIERLKKELAKIVKWSVLKEDYINLGDRIVDLKEEYPQELVLDKDDEKEIKELDRVVKKYVKK